MTSVNSGYPIQILGQDYYIAPPDANIPPQINNAYLQIESKPVNNKEYNVTDIGKEIKLFLGKLASRKAFVNDNFKSSMVDDILGIKDREPKYEYSKYKFYHPIAHARIAEKTSFLYPYINEKRNERITTILPQKYYNYVETLPFYTGAAGDVITASFTAQVDRSNRKITFYIFYANLESNEKTKEIDILDPPVSTGIYFSYSNQSFAVYRPGDQLSFLKYSYGNGDGDVVQALYSGSSTKSSDGVFIFFKINQLSKSLVLQESNDYSAFYVLDSSIDEQEELSNGKTFLQISKYCRFVLSPLVEKPPSFVLEYGKGIDFVCGKNHLVSVVDIMTDGKDAFFIIEEKRSGRINNKMIVKYCAVDRYNKLKYGVINSFDVGRLWTMGFLARDQWKPGKSLIYYNQFFYSFKGAQVYACRFKLSKEKRGVGRLGDWILLNGRVGSNIRDIFWTTNGLCVRDVQNNLYKINYKR